MNFKEILKLVFFSSLSIIAFLLITILSSWLGIEKEFFIFIYVLVILGLIYGLIKFSWALARRKGIEYIWFLIFSIIICYAIMVNIFQIIEILYLELSWYLSLFIAFSPILFMVIAYYTYKLTAKDVVQPKVLTFLISLLLGQTVSLQLDKTIAQKAFSSYPKFAFIIDDVAEKSSALMPKMASYVKGNLGEHITNRLLTSQGYTKILSKYSGNRGIDHIFVKYKNGLIQKVQIVESKVNSSPLKPDQMTDIGILRRIELLLNKPNISQNERLVYEFIKNNIDNNKVAKQLYHHNTNTNVTTISKLGKNQEIQKTSEFKNKLIENVFNKIK